jgi:hypothetical protein
MSGFPASVASCKEACHPRHRASFHAHCDGLQKTLNPRTGVQGSYLGEGAPALIHSDLGTV